MQRSSVPFAMGVWLIIAGVLLALGNPTLARHTFMLLVPLTLVGMGVYALVRAYQAQRNEWTIPHRLLWGEVLLALVLLLVYGSIRAAPLMHRFPFMREVASVLGFPLRYHLRYYDP